MGLHSPLIADLFGPGGDKGRSGSVDIYETSNDYRRDNFAGNKYWNLFFCNSLADPL